MNEAKRKNILFAVVAVVIAVVFFFAGFGTGFGVGKGAADAPDADAGAAEMDGGMQLSSDEDTDKGVSLTSVKLAREAYDDYDVMPIAETAYTVTATVSGDGLTAEQKSVTWGDAVFKDPSSEWATGKNVSDYVKTTPNGNQLTVQCLKAFGEQIIIKCSSSFNPNVSKDLKVDYKEKINGVNFKAQSDVSAHSFSIDAASVGSNLGKIFFGDTYTFSASAVFSDCTIKANGTVNFYSVTLSIPTAAVRKKLSTAGYTKAFKNHDYTVSYSSSFEFSKDVATGLFSVDSLDNCVTLVKAITTLQDSKVAAIHTIDFIQVTIDFIAQGGTYDGPTSFNFYFNIDASSLRNFFNQD